MDFSLSPDVEDIEEVGFCSLILFDGLNEQKYMFYIIILSLNANRVD